MIFGTSAPKFIVGATTVLLDNVIMNPVYADPRFIEQISVVNGERTFESLGEYSEFTIVLNLFKEGNVTAVKNKFNEIYQYLNTDIDKFYPHRDGTFIKDSSGVAVKFTMTNFEPFYLENVKFRDKLRLTFKSQAYTHLGNSLL